MPLKSKRYCGYNYTMGKNYVLFFDENFDIIQITSASIKTTMIVPVHTPALKMPPITSQLETITVTIINNESNGDVFCFI